MHTNLYLSNSLPIHFRKIVPIFYIILTSICTIAQIAMFMKKKIEDRRDRLVVGNIYQQSPTSTRCMNNQSLNQYLFTTAGSLIIILIVVIVGYTHIPLFYNVFLSYFSFNADEKMLLTQDFQEITLNLCIPLYIYWKNDELFNYLAYEILNLPHSLQSLQTPSHSTK